MEETELKRRLIFAGLLLVVGGVAGGWWWYSSRPDGATLAEGGAAPAGPGGRGQAGAGGGAGSRPAVVPSSQPAVVVSSQPDGVPSSQPVVVPNSQNVTSADFGFRDADLPGIAAFAAALWGGERPSHPAALQVPSGGVYLAARERGRRLDHSWGSGGSAGLAFTDAVRRLRGRMGERSSRADHLEVFVARAFKDAQPYVWQERVNALDHRGDYGLQIGSGRARRRYSPTYMLASNRSYKRLIERYGERLGLSGKALWESELVFLLGPQLLVRLGDRPSAQAMLRGNRIVPLERVNRAEVEAFTQRMAQWMWNSLHGDGRMTYLYWPSRAKEAPSRDNLIRQWMATIALGRVASRAGDAALWKRSAANIDYNLAKYYRQEGGLGLVELGGKVKLGAVALAALAIVVHRDRKRWAAQETALRRTVQQLWQQDGSFRTFFKPKERNDNQNFYPGEALLLWATLHAREPSARLVAQLMRSFRYYRAWHLDETVPNRRNPAFIPWHTQAYYLVWRQTRDERLRRFIFEINDWLLAVQQWDDVAYPDLRGRFYRPDRPYGPPHASSTGVYLEGLIDAYSLARQVGDSQRQKRYAQAIRRGLRSSMQLQFVDELDMFYVRDKQAVRGGLRTRVYDNQIRCDNVQHTLMGTLKILDSGLLGRSGRSGGP